jgi:hypothetical protein
MRARIRLLLVLATALPLLAATCVTSTRQRGPVGPWVGEVVNTGDAPMREVAVTARITDARGWTLDGFTVYTCPSFLMPGERAAFELFFPTGANLDVTPPLRADFSPVASGWAVEPGYPTPSDASGEGLLERTIGTYPDKRAALVEVRNESAATYSQLTVCATLRTPTGTLAEVGHADVFPSVLHPGEKATVPVFFNTMPDGVVEAIARGSSICCIAPLSFDPAEFDVQHTRVVTSGGERKLLVAGEMRNRAGQDIGWIRVGAYAEDDPVTRVTPELACGGKVRSGDAAAALFAIPLEGAISSPGAVITGIEAAPYGTSGPTLAVSAVALSKQAAPIDGLDAVTVTATLRNRTSKWINGTNACATLRDRRGDVVGVGSLFEPPRYGYSTIAIIPPGGSTTVTGVVFIVAEAASANVDASGESYDQSPIISPRER